MSQRKQMKNNKSRIQKMLDGEIDTSRARKLVERMSKLDWELLGGSIDIELGGDGDLGEFLIPLLHIALEEEANDK